MHIAASVLVWLSRASGRSRGSLGSEWVDLLDHYRELRHRNRYDVSLSVSVREAEDAIEAAARFLKRMRRLWPFGYL